MPHTAASTYPYFMSHPFWDALRIHAHADTVQTLQQLTHPALSDYITAAVRGFYPISYASLQAFRRFSELAEDAEAKAIAREIYLVEKGDKPLVPGSPLTGVPHCDQLKMMFESLLDSPLDITEPTAFAVLQQADIDSASLVKAMAICDMIEHTAPYVIHFYQDFLLQCQIALMVPSERIQRTYLDEHNLTEGDACEDQHIEMLDKMKGAYRHLAQTPEYAAEQAAFSQLVEAHFEQQAGRMQQLRPAA
jgi:hypothetical protein